MIGVNVLMWADKQHATVRAAREGAPSAILRRVGPGGFLGTLQQNDDETWAWSQFNNPDRDARGSHETPEAAADALVRATYPGLV